MPSGDRRACCPEPGLNVGQPFSVRLHALVAERAGVGDWIKLEVVDLAVELERDHPVDEFGYGHLGGGCGFRVEFEQPTAGIADDAAGVVGSRDDLDRRGKRLVRHGVHGRRMLRGHRLLEHVDGLVHPAAVSVGRAPAVELGAGADEGQDGVRKICHGHDSRHRTWRR